MKTITVFTPTYNRAYCLHKLYDSLCRQTSNDFEWLVIDDGSTDNTEKLIQQWQAENRIEIRYHYKKNGGMHTGHNAAYKLINTELNVCIDSDDYMPDNAIEDILCFWDTNKSPEYAGIVGLDAFENGEIVSGKEFPENTKAGKYFQLKQKYGIKGDIKFVYRTDVIKNYPPYPEFENEKLTPLGYKYRLIDQDYDMLFLNKVLCVVEYMEDGSSKSIIKQYFKSPRGFRHSRLATMKFSDGAVDRFIQASHFIKESIICKDFNILKNNDRKIMTLCAIPTGIMFYFYFKSKLNG